MGQTSRQVGFSAGANCFIYLSLNELCALKSSALRPTGAAGQGAAVVLAHWCARTEERKKGRSQAPEMQRGEIRHHHDAACAGSVCKVRELCLRALLSPCLGCAGQGAQPSIRESGFPQSWSTDYPEEVLRENFIFLHADVLLIPSAGKQTT